MPLAGKPALNTEELAKRLKPFGVGKRLRKKGGRDIAEFYNIENYKKFKVLPIKKVGKTYSWCVVSELLDFFNIDEEEFLLPKKIRRSKDKVIK